MPVRDVGRAAEDTAGLPLSPVLCGLVTSCLHLAAVQTARWLRAGQTGD